MTFPEKLSEPVEVTRNVVVDDELNVLLLMRAFHDKKDPGKWEVPGGKMDPGETVEEAFDREMREECGDLEVVLLYDTYHRTEPRIIRDGKYKGRQYISTSRLLRVVSGEVTIDETEHQSFLWIPIDTTKKQKPMVRESRAAIKYFRPIAKQLFDVQ